MFWKTTTGAHDISVDPSGVTLTVGRGHSASASTVTHLQFMDGLHHGRVQTEHGEAVLGRALAECHRYVDPRLHRALNAARLAVWRSLPMDAGLERIAARPDAAGQRAGAQPEWTVEFNPLERVRIAHDGATWTAAHGRQTAHPTRQSTVLVAGQWLYTVGPGVHIHSTTGHAALAAASIEPALGVNPWGFGHCVHAHELYRAGDRVVATYSLPEAVSAPELRRLIDPHGLVELCPRRGIVSRLSTERFRPRRA